MVPSASACGCNALESECCCWSLLTASDFCWADVKGSSATTVAGTSGGGVSAAVWLCQASEIRSRATNEYQYVQKGIIEGYAWKGSPTALKVLTSSTAPCNWSLLFFGYCRQLRPCSGCCSCSSIRLCGRNQRWAFTRVSCTLFHSMIKCKHRVSFSFAQVSTIPARVCADICTVATGTSIDVCRHAESTKTLF